MIAVEQPPGLSFERAEGPAVLRLRMLCAIASGS